MTYEEYLGIYTGIEAIDENDFAFYSEKAAALLSSFTGGRSEYADDDEVIYALVEIAQYLFENQAHRGVIRETNDGLGLTYGDTDEEAAAYAIAKAWLGDSGLMYCGIEMR